VLRENNETLQTTLSKLTAQDDQKEKELTLLRSRTSLSQQNWTKEREDLTRAEAVLRKEYEAAREAMQDWEVLAMEERSIRQGLSEKVADLEEQLATVRDAHERAASERDTQANTVEGLQRAFQDIQEGKAVLD